MNNGAIPESGDEEGQPVPGLGSLSRAEWVRRISDSVGKMLFSCLKIHRLPTGPAEEHGAVEVGHPGQKGLGEGRRLTCC